MIEQLTSNAWGWLEVAGRALGPRGHHGAGLVVGQLERAIVGLRRGVAQDELDDLVARVRRVDGRDEAALVDKPEPGTARPGGRRAIVEDAKQAQRRQEAEGIIRLERGQGDRGHGASSVSGCSLAR